MATIYIPPTLEALTEGLSGIDRLLTAKRWERAAFVFAWTAPGEGGSDTNPPLGVKAFARLGFRGLTTPSDVREYRKAWESAAAEVGNDDMLKIQPGDAVDAPDLPWKDYYGEPTVDVQERVAKAYITKNPEVVREAITAIPAVRAVVVDEVTEDKVLQADIEQSVFRKKHSITNTGPTTPLAPITRPGIDYSMLLNRALSDLSAVFRAISRHEWAPSSMDNLSLVLLRSLMDENDPSNGKVLSDIDQFLKENAR